MPTPDQSDRQRSMTRAYRSYTGNPRNPLIVPINGVDDNLVISLGRLIVDKGASFLFGQGVESQITDGQPEPKEDWLEECWRRNKKELTLLKLATNGGIFGHAFLRILDTNPYPRCVVLDPQTVTVLTDPDDIDTVWKFTITPPPVVVDEDLPPVERRTIIATPNGLAARRTQDPETWTIIDQTLAGGSWVTDATLQWPWPFCPIMHCQNLPKANDFWGEADLPEDILKLLDGINRVSSHYNKIVRLHAHPKIYATGMGTRTIDTAIDAVISLPSADAKLQALEMQSDLSSTMALLEKLLDLLSFMVRIPMVALGQPDNLGAISGVALRIRFQPILEKTEAKRLTYGDLMVETDRCLLCMAGFGDAIIPTLKWPEMLPQNLLEERQIAVLDDSLGVASLETLSETLGYDWEQEQQRITDEHQAKIDAGLIPDPNAPPVVVAPGTVPTNGKVPAPAAISAPMPQTAINSKEPTS